MANERSQQTGPDAPDERPDEDVVAGHSPCEEDEATCEHEDLPELEVAKEALRRAKEQVKDARRAYWHLRRQAVDQLKQIRDKPVGDIVDETLKRVKRYPGPSVMIAVGLGFFLGRLFRR